MLPLLLLLVVVMFSANCSIKQTSSTGESVQIDPSKPLNGLMNFDFILPVSTSKIFFTFKAPHKFRSLQPLSAMMNGPQGMMEFIPVGEHAHAWSRIITIIRYVGFSVQAADLQFQLKDTILAAQDVDILEQSITQEKAYKSAKFMATYKEDNGRKELVYAEHYSGPLDACEFQYTVALVNGMTQEEAIKEIQDFVQANTKLVDPEKIPELKELQEVLNASKEASK